MFHEHLKFSLSLLRGMCVVNVVVDRIPQAPLQVKVEHRSVGKVHFLLELTGVFCQLISVGRHVSNKYGI